MGGEIDWDGSVESGEEFFEAVVDYLRRGVLCYGEVSCFDLDWLESCGGELHGTFRGGEIECRGGECDGAVGSSLTM